MSYVSKAAGGNGANGGQQQDVSYAEAAAEDPDSSTSVVREDRVGHSETK